MPDSFATVDDYIASFPDDVRVVLDRVRQTIRDAAPMRATETISYQMPTLTLDGKHLVYFAAWKHHIAFYAIPTLGEDLEDEIAPYRAAKDAVRFPLAKPVPYDLIERLVAVLVERRASM